LSIIGAIQIKIDEVGARNQVWNFETKYNFNQFDYIYDGMHQMAIVV